MKLVIDTQYMENYGAHDWDGTGECPQYWKFKGGDEYMVENCPTDVDPEEVIAMLGQEVAWDSVGSRSYVLGWRWEEDGYMSQFERDQMEYDGRIAYPSPRVDYAEVQTRYADPYAYAEEAAEQDAIYYGA